VSAEHRPDFPCGVRTRLREWPQDAQEARRGAEEGEGVPGAGGAGDRKPEGQQERCGVDAGDWPEDFEHENGRYFCRCIECGGGFIGHKRRVVCKLCATLAGPDPGCRETRTPEGRHEGECIREARFRRDLLAGIRDVAGSGLVTDPHDPDPGQWERRCMGCCDCPDCNGDFATEDALDALRTENARLRDALQNVQATAHDGTRHPETRVWAMEEIAARALRD
jgi:hypothetical protein